MFRRGFDADIVVVIGSQETAFSAQEWGVDTDCNPDDVSNTNARNGNGTTAAAKGFRSIIPDVRQATVTLRNPSYDDADSPFQAPFNFVEGTYVSVNICPNGNTPGQHRHRFPYLLVRRGSHTGRVPGPQPVTIILENDGDFYEDEVIPA